MQGWYFGHRGRCRRGDEDGLGAGLGLCWTETGDRTPQWEWTHCPSVHCAGQTQWTATSNQKYYNDVPPTARDAEIHRRVKNDKKVRLKSKCATPTLAVFTLFSDKRGQIFTVDSQFDSQTHTRKHIRDQTLQPRMKFPDCIRTGRLNERWLTQYMTNIYWVGRLLVRLGCMGLFFYCYSLRCN